MYPAVSSPQKKIFFHPDFCLAPRLVVVQYASLLMFCPHYLQNPTCIALGICFFLLFFYFLIHTTFFQRSENSCCCLLCLQMASRLTLCTQRILTPDSASFYKCPNSNANFRWKYYAFFSKIEIFRLTFGHPH